MDPTSPGHSRTVARSIEHAQQADGLDEPRALSHSCKIDQKRAAGCRTGQAQDTLAQMQDRWKNGQRACESVALRKIHIAIS